MAAFSSPSFSTAQAASPNRPPSPRITIRSLRLRLDFGPRVAQRDGAVEHQLPASAVWGAVWIYREVAQPLELVAAPMRGVPQAGLELRARNGLKRLRIQVDGEILAFRDNVRIFAGEQRFVDANLRVDRMRRRNPVDGRFDLA